MMFRAPNKVHTSKYKIDQGFGVADNDRSRLGCFFVVNEVGSEGGRGVHPDAS